MAANNFLPFANVDSGTNLLTQAEYAADSQRTSGNQPGIGRSKLANKAMRQSSLLTAALGKFIADRQGADVVDTLTPDDLVILLLNALRGGAVFTTPSPLDNSNLVATTAFVRAELLQQGNAVYNAIFGSSKVTNGYQRLPGGLIIQWQTALFTNAGAVISFPIAYTTAVFSTQALHIGTTPSIPGSFSIFSPSLTSFTGYSANAAGGPFSASVLSIGY